MINTDQRPNPTASEANARRRAPGVSKGAPVTDTGVTRRVWIGASGAALAAVGFPAVVRAATALAPASPVRLSLNENPFGPSPRAVAAIHRELANVSRYTGDEAAALMRDVAAREAVSPDQIVLGEILDVLGFHLAQEGGPGGEFIYSEPGYTALVDAVTPAGGVVVGVPLNAQMENDLPAIAAKVNTRTRGVYVVNPHNPTGTVSDPAEFKQFVSGTAKRTTVIVDEAYLEFEPDFERRSTIDFSRTGENVVVFRTFAKIYGLAGLAIGYAVAPTALAAALRRKGIGAPHSLDRLAVAAAAASLDDDGFVAAIRLKVAAEREKWTRLFRRLNIRHADSRGNFVFFETGRPHKVVANTLLADGIEIARAFPPFDNWVRISIGLPQENVLARRAITKLLQ